MAVPSPCRWTQLSSAQINRLEQTDQHESGINARSTHQSASRHFGTGTRPPLHCCSDCHVMRLKIIPILIYDYGGRSPGKAVLGPALQRRRGA
jgi:hypothetical protein